jgi:uncharacterized protein (TIGR00255 family)
MIRSMTGYGKAEVEENGAHVAVETSSVNHRYLEVSVRLPKPLAVLESRVRKVVQERVVRGKVTVVISRDLDRNGTPLLCLDEKRLEGYLEVARELSGRPEIGGTLDINQVISLPDVVVEVAADEDLDLWWRPMERALVQALDALLELRTTEGAELARDMLARVDEIERHLGDVERRAPSRVTEARDKMKQRIAQILSNGEADPYRIEQEIAVQADRLDCTEECVRLRSHLKHFREFAAEAESSGRKLNFLLQEMNREATTIGSKANDASVAMFAVRMKEEIERIREQVQNIE